MTGISRGIDWCNHASILLTPQRTLTHYTHYTHCACYIYNTQYSQYSQYPILNTQ